MQLCLALDLESMEDNLALLSKLSSLQSDCFWVKVGLRSFIRDGIRLIDEIKALGFKIFLDLKLYDIPNTMADAAYSCALLGVDMITIHTSSGREAMSGVMARLKEMEQKEGKKRPLVFGVTALTSFDDASFSEIYHAPIDTQATILGIMAYESGLDGIVCSVFESLEIKAATNPSFLTLTPGIRPFAESSDDQKRVASIAQAKESKSDFLVIGRPIYKDDNPLAITQKILQEIQSL